MKRLQLITALSLISLLSGCGGGGEKTAEPNKNLYGTWVEPQTKGEVVFRRNSTVNWNGTEGTYELLEKRGWSCWDLDYSPETCKEHILITLPDQTISIFGHGPADHAPDRWSHWPREFLRKDSFEYPVMPSHFERIPQELAIGSYSKDEFDPTTSVLQAWALELISNQLIQTFVGDHRFDKELNKWVHLVEPNQFAPSPVTSNQDKVSSAQLIYLWSHDIVSLDGGITWKSVPPGPTEADFPEPLILGTKIFLPRLTDRYTETGYICERKDLWMLDATTERPSWELRNTFDCQNDIETFLEEELVRKVNHQDIETGNGYYTYFISQDRGLTWTDWDSPPATFNYNSGYVLSSETLHWYNVDTQTWSTHTVDFDLDLGVKPGRGGLYFQRGQEIREWHQDGTETLITTLPSGDFSARFVGNDLYVSNIFGLWRVNL
jgi:hypothetical protein